MGVKPQTKEEQQIQELDNKNAGKKWEIGSDGSEIEPLPGEQVIPEEVEKQFLSDFGDALNNIEDVDVTAIEEIENAPPGPTNQQQVPTTENEVVTSDGRVLNPQNNPVAPVVGQVPKKNLTASEQINAKQVDVQPVVEQVDLNNYVAKSLHDEVVANYNGLQGKFNDLKGKMDSVKGLENMSTDELTYLRKIKHDYENSPLGIIVSDYYNKKFDAKKFVPLKESPQQYMEGDALFDANDSYQAGSESFKARTQFEQDQRNITDTYQQVANYLSEEHNKDTKTPKEMQDEWETQQQGLFDQVSEKFPNAKKNLPTFQAWLNQQKNVYLPLYAAFTQVVKIAMEAKRGGRQIPPNPNIPAGTGEEEVYNLENTDPEMSEVFGDQ